MRSHRRLDRVLVREPSNSRLLTRPGCLRSRSKIHGGNSVATLSESWYRGYPTCHHFAQACSGPLMLAEREKRHTARRVPRSDGESVLVRRHRKRSRKVISVRERRYITVQARTCLGAACNSRTLLESGLRMRDGEWSFIYSSTYGKFDPNILGTGCTIILYL